MKEIRETFKLLFDAQQELGAVWILPDAKSNLHFVLTELGEVVDAYMRQDVRYFRNNAKELSIEKEIADVLMMLIKYGLSTSHESMLDAIDKFDIDLVSFDMERIYLAIEAICKFLLTYDVFVPETSQYASVAFAFVVLYEMLPEGYLLQAMIEKMNKYRSKIQEKNNA